MEPYCDSDEEVFYGPVTLKEVKKALSLRRRTEVHENALNMGGADAKESSAARRKEETVHNLTFTPQMNRKVKEYSMWDRRSLDVNAVKLFIEEEAPAPPPSPEKMEFKASACPTPYSSTQIVCQRSLHEIAEKDEVNSQLDTCNTESALSKLSFLTTMNDSLTEDLHKPVPAAQEESDDKAELAQGINMKPRVSKERASCRNILLEKMKEYESQERHIKSMKRAPVHKIALEDNSLVELSSDDLLILNDVENDDFFSEESNSSLPQQCDNGMEVQDHSAGMYQIHENLHNDNITDLDISHPIPERANEKPLEARQHLAGFSNNFLGDFERRYGKQRLNEVLASLSSEVEGSPERSSSPIDISSPRMRPISPEYDVNENTGTDKTHEARCSSPSDSTCVSLSNSVVEISTLEEDYSAEIGQLSYSICNISIADEYMVEMQNDQLSPVPGRNNGEIENSVIFPFEKALSEGARITRDEHLLYSGQNSKEISSEFDANSKIQTLLIENATKQDNFQTEASLSDSVTEISNGENSCQAEEFKSRNYNCDSQASLSNSIIEIPIYVETEYTETVCDNLEKNNCNVGGKSYIMSDEYSLISEAESEPHTPINKANVYGAEPCIGLASFDEKVVPRVDKDGGFLSVLSEAALLHATLAHHNNSINGQKKNDSQTLSHVGSANNVFSEPDVDCKDNELGGNVSHKCENKKESSSGSNHISGESEIHLNTYGSSEVKENKLKNKQGNNISYISDSSVSSVQANNHCGGETDAFDDLNETDKHNLGQDTSMLSIDTEERFNDTLEEMEMLLKYGSSYMFSNNENIGKSACRSENVEAVVDSLATQQNGASGKHFEPALDKEKHNLNDITDISKQPSLFNVAQHLPEISISPIPHRTQEKSQLPVMKKTTPPHSPDKVQQHFLKQVKVRAKELESPFKIPAKPPNQGALRPGTPRVVKQKPLPPTLPITSPLKKTGYKKIISPVGMYIHNTPSPSLVANVKPKVQVPSKFRTVKASPVPSSPLSSTLQRTPEQSKASTVSPNDVENIDINNIHTILPVVTYKSVPALKLDEKEKKKLPKINDKMKRLIDTPRPHVIRHEGRMKVDPSPQMKRFVSPKLSNFSKSSFNASNSSAEISVVVEKKAIRTNTVGI